MSEVAPEAAPSAGIPIPVDAAAPPPQEELDNATETLYIQNLNEKIKISGMSLSTPHNAPRLPKLKLFHGV